MELFSRLDNVINIIDNESPLIKYKISKDRLHLIRKSFLNEMEIGLKEQDILHSPRPKISSPKISSPKLSKSNNKSLYLSSLKMQPTHVFNIPNGDERGVYYTLDWGGTNYRVLKTRLYGRKNGSKSIQKCEKISDTFMKTKHASVLFDHVATKLKQFMIEEKDYNDTKEFPIGFCFSFPIKQPKLSSGVLMHWTKGFTVPNVIDNDVTDLMHSAFDRHGLSNVRIKSIVNDTVGTLLACAYEHDYTRIGVILGTGTNCAYIEPKRGDEVINVEWGDFGRTDNTLPRVNIDYILDSITPNPGSHLVEKMMSGMYSGELVRLALLEILKNKITDYSNNSILNKQWKWPAAYTGALLQCCESYKSSLTNDFNFNINNDNNNNDNINENDPSVNRINSANSISSPNNVTNPDNIIDFESYQNEVKTFMKDRCGLDNFSWDDCELFIEICYTIIERGADICAAMLAAVLQRTGLFDEDSNGNINICKSYKDNNDKYIVVGIDGSVYNKDKVFRERLKMSLKNIIGENAYEKVRMVRTEDGSGRGAALAAAEAQIADASMHQMYAIGAPLQQQY